ncbi:hypothetical protein [Chryseobacterium sp. c4a]|uniref:hypothetical protein n=1 Tax=Chryseobacterium sp. c4a TaxID=1573582 RepID=UPI00135C9429|nr:hypothetical protein [Chryseobacterium sp. c4a]
MNASLSLLEAILNLLQKKMRDSSSNYYLPDLLKQLDNPNINPYVVDGDWDLDNLSGDSITTGANQICLQATPDQYYPAQGISSSPPQIVLSSIQVAGLINVLPEKPNVIDPDSDAPKVSVVLDFCTILNSGLPTTITVNGNFTLSQSCCIPNRGSQVCDSSSSKFGTDGEGTFSAVISPAGQNNQLTMNCDSVITVQPDSSFLVTVNSMIVAIPKTALTISVTINSAGKGDKKTYEKLAEEALNSDGAKTQILAQLQEQLSSDTARNQIGTMITNQLNSILSQAVF